MDSIFHRIQLDQSHFLIVRQELELLHDKTGVLYHFRQIALAGRRRNVAQMEHRTRRENVLVVLGVWFFESMQGRARVVFREAMIGVLHRQLYDVRLRHVQMHLFAPQERRIEVPDCGHRLVVIGELHQGGIFLVEHHLDAHHVTIHSKKCKKCIWI